jgi:hypothetical protein
VPRRRGARPAYRRRNPSVRLDPRERRRNPIPICGPGAVCSSFPRKRPRVTPSRDRRKRSPGVGISVTCPPVQARGRLWIPARAALARDDEFVVRRIS